MTTTEELYWHSASTPPAPTPNFSGPRDCPDEAWALAQKVRAALDRKSCPGVYLDLAVDAVCQHWPAPTPPAEPPVTETIGTQFVQMIAEIWCQKPNAGIREVLGTLNEMFAPPVEQAERPCTCHPDDDPPQPCAKQYALSECKAAAPPQAAQPPAGVGQWVPAHERVPARGTECVVLLQLYGLPFVSVDTWDVQREDPTGMGGPTGEGWNENFERNVIAWKERR